jgi:hypothetical protein
MEEVLELLLVRSNCFWLHKGKANLYFYFFAVDILFSLSYFRHPFFFFNFITCNSTWQRVHLPRSLFGKSFRKSQPRQIKPRLLSHRSHVKQPKTNRR